MPARPSAELEKRISLYDGKVGPNGRRLCRWCGTEVPKGRRTYCSDACVHEWLLRSDSKHLRAAVFRRDRGVCAACGLDTDALAKRLYRMSYDARYGRPLEFRMESRRRFLEIVVALGFGDWRGFRIPHLWEADHIVPVAEGGDSCLENVRTLCWRCHRSVTADYARERAARRREITGTDNPQGQLDLGV